MEKLLIRDKFGVVEVTFEATPGGLKFVFENPLGQKDFTLFLTPEDYRRFEGIFKTVEFANLFVRS